MQAFFESQLTEINFCILLHCYQTENKFSKSKKTKMASPQKPQFSAVQRAFAVKCFHETKSGKLTRTLYSQKFCDNRNVNRPSAAHVPSISAIKRWVRAFANRGSVENKNASGKEKLLLPKSLKFKQRTDQNFQRVEESVRISPKASIRRRSAQLNIPRASLHRILKLDLKLKPYVIQVHQRLTPLHAQQRIQMCNWFLQEIEQNPNFLENIWFSDEAHFYLNGHVNNKNFVFWGSQKPFFFEIGGETATINSERYVAVLDRFWRSLGETFGQAFLRNQWFQQDGASVHVSGVSLDWIRRHFAERVISRRTDRPWSPNSPDLSPLDFHLWGFLKDELRGNTFGSTVELKAAISEATQRIPIEQCQRVMANFVLRLKKCIEKKGFHLEHII